MTDLMQAHANFSAILASFAVSWRLALARANEEATRLRNEANSPVGDASGEPADLASARAAVREKIIRQEAMVGALKVRIDAAKEGYLLYSESSPDPSIPQELIDMAKQTGRFDLFAESPPVESDRRP
jgi:hypothetical protein